MTTDGANLSTQCAKSHTACIPPFQHPTSNPPVSYTNKDLYRHRALTRGFYWAGFPPQQHLSKEPPIPLLPWQVTQAQQHTLGHSPCIKHGLTANPRKAPTPSFSVLPVKRQFLKQNPKKSKRSLDAIWTI